MFLKEGSKNIQSGCSIICKWDKRNYKCSVEECSRNGYAKGLCFVHYGRNRKGLNINSAIRNKKRGAICIDCGKILNKKSGWGRCSNHYRKFRLHLIKKIIVQFFGGKCAKCLQNFPDCVFDFHHLDKNIKEESPAKMMNTNSTEKIAQELSKCILLCANCHRKEHFGQF
jgi:hypothetical protein